MTNEASTGTIFFIGRMNRSTGRKNLVTALSDPNSFSRALSVQIRVFNALFQRELDERLGVSGITYLLGLMEPILHIAVLATWHYMIRAVPIYGTNKILFLATGMYPVYAFIHMSGHLQFSARMSKRSFPLTTPLDHVFVEFAHTFIIYAITGVVLFTGIYLFFTPQAYPTNWSKLLFSMLALYMMGFGMGLCNVAITQTWEWWHFVYGGIARAMIFFSGILFVPDFLPLILRHYLSWNPILQGVDLFRQAFYPTYPTTIYDSHLLWWSALVVLAIGLTLQQGLFRHPSQA